GRCPVCPAPDGGPHAQDDGHDAACAGHGPPLGPGACRRTAPAGAAAAVTAAEHSSRALLAERPLFVLRSNSPWPTTRLMNAPVNLPGRFDSLPRFASALKAIESLKPSEPLYLVHPEKFAAAAKQFLDGFPGDVLYAVKANPHPIAL